MTSKPLPENPDSSKLLQLDFHAKIYPWLANSEASEKVQDQDYFMKSLDYLGKFNLNSSSLKTLEISCLTKTGRLSKKSSSKLPKQGMMRNGQLFRQKIWEPVISDSDSGSLPTKQVNTEIEQRESLPTPTTMDHLPPRGYESMVKQTQVHRKGRTKLANLREAVNPETVELFNKLQNLPHPIENPPSLPTSMEKSPPLPTPTASDVEGGVAKDVQYENGNFFRENKKGERWGVKLRDSVSILPTPTSRDWKDGSFKSIKNCKKWDRLPRKIHLVLPTPTANEHKATAQDRPNQSGRMLSSLARRNELSNQTGDDMFLNPHFVEEMMGYPIGWLV